MSYSLVDVFKRNKTFHLQPKYPLTFSLSIPQKQILSGFWGTSFYFIFIHLLTQAFLFESVYLVCTYSIKLCCILTTSCFFVQHWFWENIVLTPLDLAYPSKSLYSILSMDSELCLFIPVLMNIRNFIYILINIFVMHKNFFRAVVPTFLASGTWTPVTI